jgi:hypothetical protein
VTGEADGLGAREKWDPHVDPRGACLGARGTGRRPPLVAPLSGINEYTATAHDGLIGAEHSGNGFVCWKPPRRARLTDRSGQTDVVVMPGRRARAIFGSTVVPEPFVPSASVLEVRTSGPVLPLLRMPDGRIAAGFLAGEVEVNQVFGLAHERQGGGRWLVEVPCRARRARIR